MRRAWMMGAAAAVLFSIGCENQKPELQADFSDDLAAADGKADSINVNSTKVKVLGSLNYGDSANAKYDGKTKYLAYTFNGNQGDTVTIDVTSKKGDAYAWLTDATGKIIAHNDDYDGSLNSHIAHVLPGNADGGVTLYYIVFKEYSGNAASFTVSLKGKAADYFSCKVDSDCVAEPQGGCCPHGYKTAVNTKEVKAWEKTQQCNVTPHPICPLYLVDDTRVAECNNGTHQCEMVAIDAIQCGGFIANQHHCPDGYDCTGAKNPDLPGMCTESEPSPSPTTEPSPSPTTEPSPSPTTEPSPSPTTEPSPSPTTCVDTVDCIKGDHWSSVQCACVPN